MAMLITRVYVRGTTLIVETIWVILECSQPDLWEQRVKELVYALAPIVIGEGLKTLF